MKKRVYKFNDEIPAKIASPGAVAAAGDNTFYGAYLYDAVGYSPARKYRPYFAADSAATLTTWTRTRALSLARWAYINVPIVKGAVDLNARLTVGTGFSPKTHMADERLAAAADSYVLEQFKDIGFTHGESMDELLLHDSRSTDIDGDIGYVLTQDEFSQPKIQTIEAHRIKNGDVKSQDCIDGIWIDSYGRRVAYNVALPDDSQDYYSSNSGPTTRIDSRDFVYLAERNRPDELRSMTNLIHALNPLQDLYEIIAFATASAKKNAEIGLIIQTPDPSNPPGVGPTIDQMRRARVAGTTDQPAQARQSVTYEQVYGSGGKIPILKPGEKLESFSHEHPSPTLKEWSEFIIRGISVGFGLPFEILWNPENIGGANTRLITAMVRQRVQQRRAALVFPKLTRVRFWILSRAVKRGILPAADYTTVEWRPNFQDITVDAGRESKERRENVLHGLDTFSGYFAENGESYEEQIAVRKSDLSAQCAAATELTKQFPQLSFSDALSRISLLGNSNKTENVTTNADQTDTAGGQTKNNGQPMNISIDARPAGKRSFSIKRENGTLVKGEIIDETE